MRPGQSIMGQQVTAAAASGAAAELRVSLGDTLPSTSVPGEYLPGEVVTVTVDGLMPHSFFAVRVRRVQRCCSGARRAGLLRRWPAAHAAALPASLGMA